MPRSTRRRFLRQSAQVIAGLALPACIFEDSRPVFAADEPLDLLIAGGTLVDGSGGAGQTADLGIRGGRIVAIGGLADRPTGRRIAAEGLVVAPGFIDVHTHSDTTLLRDGLAQSAVRQGAT